MAGAESDGAHVLNIDHHHDNTRFGTVNHVVDEASCTAEIVWDLMGGLGVRADGPGRRRALRRAGHRHRPLHVRQHRPARARDGRRPHRGRRRRPRDLPPASTRACRSASWRCSAARSTHVSASTTARLTHDLAVGRRLRAADAEESYSEGVIDHLRAVEGTKVAALVRDRLGPDQEGERKVSLRATDDDVDVSRIARARGGGGHRRAAGFTTELGDDELIAFLRAAVREQTS